MGDLEDIKNQLDSIQTILLYLMPKERLKVFLENEPDFPKDMIEDIIKKF